MKNKDIKNQLLCTFFERKNQTEILNQILANYYLIKDTVYINRTDDNRLFFCYNVDKNEALSKKLKRTIMVHRKKETNTIYTINSLNELQRVISNGNLEERYDINWENYKNQLLMFSNNELTINKIELLDAVLIKYLDNQK